MRQGGESFVQVGREPENADGAGVQMRKSRCLVSVAGGTLVLAIGGTTTLAAETQRATAIQCVFRSSPTLGFHAAIDFNRSQARLTAIGSPQPPSLWSLRWTDDVYQLERSVNGVVHRIVVQRNTGVAGMGTVNSNGSVEPLGSLMQCVVAGPRL
jgi:hypothetical protein